MKKRNLALTILLAFISWTPSARAYDLDNYGNLTVAPTPGVNLVTGDLSGTYTAPLTTVDAFGLYFDNNININGNFRASASATIDSHLDDNPIGRYAYGIHADNGDIVMGGLSGTVTALAGDGDVSVGGIHTAGNIIINGNLSGTVSATAGDLFEDLSAPFAGGIMANQDIIISGDLSGTVSAKVGGGTSTEALGMSGSNISIANISGKVTAESGENTAIGIAFGNYDDASNSLAIGNLSGEVNATTGDGGIALGITAQGGLNESMNITTLSGKVIATAGDNGWAAGVAPGFGEGCTINIGTLSGQVNATTGDGGTAAGLGFGWGYGTSPDCAINIGTLSGSVTAVAGVEGYAFGIGSKNSISIANLTGTVSATAGSDGTAYSLYSGDQYDGTMSGRDLITLSGYSRLVGDVALNGGSDVFTLKGHADISGVPVLDGGYNDDMSSGYDQLIMNGWNGSLLGVQVTGWESIELVNASTVNLGASTDPNDPKTIEFSTLTIDPTSTLVAAGSSPGYYTLVGDVFNHGTISLLDNMDAEDRLTIAGNYYGTGSIRLDVNTGLLMADQVTITGNATGSTRLVLNVLGVPTNPVSPILLVSVQGTHAPADLFTGGDYFYGPKAYRYTLSSEGGDYYLDSLLFDRYREEAALIQGITPFVEHLGFESVTGFHERHAYNHLEQGKNEPTAVWMRGYGSSFHIGQEGDAATTIKGYSIGTQLGADLAAGRSGNGSQYHFGAYTGTAYQKADVAGIATIKAGELTQQVYNLGLYASYEKPESYYLEAVLQSGYHDITIKSPDEPRSIKTNTWSYISSLEAGITIPAGNALTLEPQVQVIYQHTGSMAFSTSIGDASVNSHDGVRTRLGMTGTFTDIGAHFNPFFEVNLIKDFADDSIVSYAPYDATLRSKPESTRFGGAIGIASKRSDNTSLAFYAKVGAMFGVNGRSSSDYTVTAGFSKAF
ncbi:MAG: autotransporter outer membrane beta-barrel domain-containing protein [Chlorobiaceae bacterium]|nr:autotransporter outer membrane beta-barrel domain-containing protein [Chlorobiaceae bacterium]